MTTGKLLEAPSSSTNSWTHDVFLSFRGKDTRHNFTGHLHNNLIQKRIKTFIDDELPRGEEISQSLLTVIEGSRCSIVVFSENYASSKWCLDELVHIIHCRESKKQMVCPVFYKLDPSDVKNQTGCIGEAIANHERKFEDEARSNHDGSKFEDNMKKVLRWKAALTKAAELSGYHYLDGSHEYEFIQTIVEFISVYLPNHHRILNVAKYPVGIESRVQEINTRLDIEETDVRMIGIWGTGGIGKTTLAKAVYNSIFHQFEGSCFLANVRKESMPHEGLVKLQNILLLKILGGKELIVTNADEGINLLKEKLRHKRVLIILDDVSKLEQLNTLAGSIGWFGSGSRIMITTRHKDLLIAHQVNLMYKVKELDFHESLELFSSNAFNGKGHHLNDCDRREIGNLVVYAQGHPLALNVLGSLVCGRSIDQWGDILDTQRRFPEEEIQEVLKISYDALKDPMKDVFLDIACFFNGLNKQYVIEVLQGCYPIKPEHALTVLIEKDLINVNQFNDVCMHDVIADMGKEIVRQQSPIVLGKRSRLWFHEDVEHVLTEHTGTDQVTGILVKFPTPEAEICLRAGSFSNMKNLRIFINVNARITGDIDYLPNELRHLEWPHYPLQSLPVNFNPMKLVQLKMPHACISKLWEGFKCMPKLKSINLDFCKFLTKTPNFSRFPNLVDLSLSYCENLVEVDDSLSSLDKLVELNLCQCHSLKLFPSRLKLKNLRRMDLGRCKMLKSFPEIEGKMESLSVVILSGTGIQELPSSIANLAGLRLLFLDGCEELTDLPHSLDELQHLRCISLTQCPKLSRFTHKVNSEASSSSADSFALTNANISHDNYEGVSLEVCNNLSAANFLVSPDCMRTLTRLSFSGNNFVSLPAFISKLISLKHLALRDCKKLRAIGRLPPLLTQLDASGCVSLERYSKLSNLLEGKDSQMIRHTNLENCQRLCDKMLWVANKTNMLLLGLSLQKFLFRVTFPGSEVPKWFTYRKDLKDFGEDNYEFCFELPPKSKWKNSGLVLCAAFEAELRISRYFIDDRCFDAKVAINEVPINDDDDEECFFSVHDKLSADNMWLCYIPLGCYMRWGRSIANTCRVHFRHSRTINNRMRYTTCGVHIVMPQEKDEVLKFKQVEESEDYMFQEGDEAPNPRKRKPEDDDDDSEDDAPNPRKRKISEDCN